MSRKGRLKELLQKREERDKSNFKKHSYHDMARKGELGCKEQQTYLFMYENIKKENRHKFKHPDENPTRQDYNSLKHTYSSDSSLEYRVGY